MFKVLFGLIISILTAQAAADINMSLVSSNQFKVGTNAIYQAIVANPDASVNVKAFGATPDGIDSTIAIQNAYNSISTTNGGILFFPVGDWRFNLVITNPNITIRGVSHMHDNSGIGTMRSRLLPADLTKPVIQIGNDSAVLRGISLENITLDGRLGGSCGVFFSGGAFENTFKNSSVNFFTNCIKFQGGTNYPCSLIYLDRVDGQPLNVVNSHGLYILNTPNYPTSYTTEIVINNCHWDGATGNGNVVEIDSVLTKFVNAYFDVSNNHGFKLSKNFSPSPLINGINLNIDGGGSGTNIVIESYNTNRFFADQIVGANIAINGVWKTSDSVPLTFPRNIQNQNGMLLYPNVTGSLNFINSGNGDYTGGTYTNNQFFADSSGNLQVVVQSTPKFITGTGSLQINSSPGTSIAFLRLFDSINNRNADIKTSAGSLLLIPANGSTQLRTSAGASALQVNATDGATFLFGASLSTNTGVYLDNNGQLKSEPVVNTTTLDFPSTAAGTSSDLTVTVTGAVVNDIAVVGPPATVNANSSFTAWVSSADTVTIRFNNYSGGVIDPASATFKVKIVK